MSLICLLSTWLLCVCRVMFIKLVLLLFCLILTCLWTCCKQNAHETYLLFCFILFWARGEGLFFPPWKGDCSYFDQFTHLVVAPCSVCYSYNYVTCTGCQIGLPMTARCSIQMQCVLSLACFSAGFIHKDIDGFVLCFILSGVICFTSRH